jgi:hypothetical protein
MLLNFSCNGCIVYQVLKWCCLQKTEGLFLCDFSSLSCKKQQLEKKSHVGLCNPPSGFFVFDFFVRWQLLHEQPAMVTALNSRRPKPWWMAA